MARSVRYGGRKFVLYRKVTVAAWFAKAKPFPLLFALLALLTFSGFAASRQGSAPAPYEKAQHARQALEARPETQRTRRDYERTLSLYRAVYHNDPASPKADASINAVAELLTEQGRLFKDDKSFHDAVGQYDFLRREYPGSRYRVDALLAQADIERHDLNDLPAAKATLQSFVKEYPHNPQATKARKQLKEIHSEEAVVKDPQSTRAETQAPTPRPTTPLTTAYPSRSATAYPSHPPASSSARHTTQSPATIAEQSPVDRPAPRSNPAPNAIAPQPTHAPAQASAVPTPPPSATQPVAAPPQPAPQPTTIADTPAPRRKGKLVSVTGVRHWSTPIYTRVAIDLGDEVQYEAARVPDPDRIFFDLHGAKLSSDLIGKSVNVTDDGFLKRIRAAQFSNDVTRIVLDVSDVSDYSAFLLPNPYRLIIDIHGRKPGTPVTQQTVLTPGSIRADDEAAKQPIAGRRRNRTSTRTNPAQNRIRGRPEAIRNSIGHK